MLGFTHDAALMASAFRMGTEQSGELMAGWRSALKLNQVQVLDLGDASSLLAQKFGALPADIGAVVRQAGAASAVLGLLPEQTAAFSAVLLQAGMNKDQASGALTTLSTALDHRDLHSFPTRRSVLPWARMPRRRSRQRLPISIWIATSYQRR